MKQAARQRPIHSIEIVQDLLSEGGSVYVGQLARPTDGRRVGSHGGRAGGGGGVDRDIKHKQNVRVRVMDDCPRARADGAIHGEPDGPDSYDTMIICCTVFEQRSCQSYFDSYE